MTFEINTEGIVNVRALDPATGTAQSTTVRLSSGLSDEEIDRIVTRGRAADVAKGHKPDATGSKAPKPAPTAAAPDREELILDLNDDEVDGEIVSMSSSGTFAEGVQEEELFGAIDSDLAEEDFGADGTQGGRLMDLEEPEAKPDTSESGDSDKGG